MRSTERNVVIEVAPGRYHIRARAATTVGLPGAESKRDRLRSMIADIEAGIRCKRCAGYGPFDAWPGERDACQCGTQW